MAAQYFPLYLTILFFVFTATYALEKSLIPFLKQCAKQPIYKEGPSWHISKSGTPTMGGLAFIFAIGTCLCLCAIFLFNIGDVTVAKSLLLVCCYSIANALIGVFDDLTKLKRKSNGGLTPSQKLVLQFALAVLFLIIRERLFDFEKLLDFGFFKLDLGIFYYPFCVLLLLGIINFSNLTDGIDGLASSVSFSIGIALFLISAANYPDVALISSALIGGSVAFLFFNIHPAKIFMGDTGSLFLGTLIISCCFALNSPLTILPLGCVFIFEGFSVIIQVVSYKLTKKRIFKMSPLHHHLEKSGYSEEKICIIAAVSTLVMSLFAYLLVMV